jgi:predicted SAM-dependent methyltransferase
MKLHIGCGEKHLSGYKHLDVIKYEHVDYVCDARHLSIIKDKTVSEIYACHILEHVGRNEVVEVLKEWNRVLKPGGIIRVAVPNFDALVEDYCDNRDLMRFHGLLYGGQTYDYNFHHVAFNELTLKTWLEEAGFSSVQRYDWQEFLPEGYDDYSRAYLPHMDIKNGRLMSLNIMATKDERYEIK